MDTSLMLDLAAQFEGVASTLRRHAATITESTARRTWTEEEAEAQARKVYPSLGSAQAFAVRALAKAHPEGVPATKLAVNPNSMPNTYDLLDNKLGRAGLVRSDDGYPRKYYLGAAFDRKEDNSAV